MNRKKLTVVGILAAILVFSVNAFADGKVYSPYSCLFYTNYWQEADAFIGNSGQMSNGENYSRYAYCPAINDSMSTAVESGWVNVFDRSDTENFSCSLKAVYQSTSGTSYYYNSNIATSSGASNNSQRLYFNSFTCSTESAIYLACSIPGYGTYGWSGIGSYYVNE